MTKLDELTQKVIDEYAEAVAFGQPGAMRGVVLAVLAEVREMVPEPMTADPDQYTAGYNDCRVYMLRRLNQATEGK